MRPPAILAIDLGASKVACAVGQPHDVEPGTPVAPTDEPAYEILGYGLADYSLSNAWPNDPATMGRAIDQALDATQVPQLPDHAVVALSHPALAHTRVTASIDLADEPVTIRNRELQRLMDQALGQVLGIDRDVLLLQPLGYAGNGFESVNDPRGLVATRLSGTFHLVSIPRAVRKAVTQAFEIAGLDVASLRYSVEATAASCLPDEAASSRVLLIDIGGVCTDVAVFDHGRLIRSRSAPWGGLALVEAIARELRLTMDQALTLCQEGLTSSKPDVRQLIEHQLRGLQRGIQEVLKDDALPAQAIVTGRGALIDGVVEWIETATGLDTALGRSPRGKRLGHLSRQMAFNTAFGLLELTSRRFSQKPSLAPSGRLLNRLLDQTKRILVDYF